MWRSETHAVPGGMRYRLLDRDSSMSFRIFVGLLRSDREFADWYSRLLAAHDAEAFYFECRPMTAAVDDAVEFVLLDAPTLARSEPDCAPFASRFAEHTGEVIAFPNLGGDALLIVPRPSGSESAYAHLAAFVRHASAGQVRALWQVAAKALAARFGAAPIWLNTEGSGVAWLHLRLDSRPKYYHHRPYAELPSN